MDNERVDLSLLDPGYDSLRWKAIMDATAVRVDAAMQQRAERADDAFVLIASWQRPLLVAAAILLALLIPAEIALEMRESRTEAIERLATVSVTWINGNHTPTGADILRAIDAVEAR